MAKFLIFTLLIRGAAWAEVVVVDLHEFQPARLRALARRIAQSQVGQALSVVKLLPKGGLREGGYASGPHLGYDAWRSIYDMTKPPELPVGEVVTWNGAASARFRLPRKPVIRVSIRGQDPFLLRAGQIDAEIVAFQKSETEDGPTKVFVKAGALDTASVRDVAQEITRRLPGQRVDVYLRRDSWFVIDSFPINFPFHVGRPPKKAQYLSSRTVVCYFEDCGECEQLTIQ